MAATFYKWLVIPTVLILNNYENQAITSSPIREVHPFYVCVTEINHNVVDKTLEISCKIFADDFEKVLTQKNKSVVSISQPKDKVALDKLINQYIKGHLSFKADNKEANFSYLGFEKENDAVYCYLQVDNISAVKKIDIVNTMLHDLNNNQINIMHVNVGGNRKSLKLDFPDSQAMFSF
jgi:hypothetical protein